jgi:hypothetical protein
VSLSIYGLSIRKWPNIPTPPFFVFIAPVQNMLWQVKTHALHAQRDTFAQLALVLLQHVLMENSLEQERALLAIVLLVQLDLIV